MCWNTVNTVRDTVCLCVHSTDTLCRWIIISSCSHIYVFLKAFKMTIQLLTRFFSLSFDVMFQLVSVPSPLNNGKKKKSSAQNFHCSCTIYSHQSWHFSWHYWRSFLSWLPLHLKLPTQFIIYTSPDISAPFSTFTSSDTSRLSSAERQHLLFPQVPTASPLAAVKIMMGANEEVRWRCYRAIKSVKGGSWGGWMGR